MLPQDTKNCKVIPIYRGDDAANPDNYRPISLLSVFEKLLKKPMYDRLDSLLHKHKIFYKYQFGFRENNATRNALTEVIDHIYSMNHLMKEITHLLSILTFKKFLILYNLIHS